jgi:hypothetical protein
MLAESWTITDEPDEPEPMEIARDAWQATQELKQLFGGVEPGMASQAQPHLDALQQFVRQIWSDPNAMRTRRRSRPECNPAVTARR